MGRTNSGNQKKPAKCSQKKRSRKTVAEAEAQGQQKALQHAAKLANESALKLKLTEKLQKTGISLSLDGLEMVEIPSGNFMPSSEPSTSKDPLNLSEISVAETIAKTETMSAATSQEETDEQTDVDDGELEDGESALDQEISDEPAKLPVQGETKDDDEELPFPMPIKASSSLIPAHEGKENLADQSTEKSMKLANQWKEKYTMQLEKTKQLSHELLLEKAKSSRLNQLVITQMAMIRELRTGKETSVFTTEAGIDITVTDIEDISSQSKHTADFAQRLALYFYGADELRKRKVTTKGDPGVNPIDPKILKFIHNKARQRVAKLEGLDAYEKIAIDADPATINKALAEKIQNLRKAHILQAARGKAFTR